jgi:hypothetical protein
MKGYRHALMCFLTCIRLASCTPLKESLTFPPAGQFHEHRLKIKYNVKLNSTVWSWLKSSVSQLVEIG